MSTKSENKRVLFMPIVKSSSQKYIAILSDDSVDRDDEIVSKKFLQKFANDKIYLPSLLDHENKVLNNIGEWINKRIEKINGHNAFVAEPRFFMSNPNAQTVKGMLDEGAKLGVSIGATITKFSNIERNGKSFRQFDDGELLEASFTPVPANKHACAMAIAKSIKGDIMPEEENKECPGKEEEVKEPSEKQDKNVEINMEKSMSAEVKKHLETKTAELEKSYSEKLEKKISEIKEELQKEYKDNLEKTLNDRFSKLEAIKRSDDVMIEKNLEQENIIPKDLEPSIANFIAARKGFKIIKGD